MTQQTLVGRLVLSQEETVGGIDGKNNEMVTDTQKTTVDVTCYTYVLNSMAEQHKTETLVGTCNRTLSTIVMLNYNSIQEINST